MQILIAVQLEIVSIKKTFQRIAKVYFLPYQYADGNSIHSRGEFQDLKILHLFWVSFEKYLTVCF